MFVGRSEEEIALAGEEMGWSPLQAVKNIFASPAAPIAAGLILGPAAGAAITLARAASGSNPPPPAPSGKSAKAAPDDEAAPAKSKPSTDSMGASALSDEHIESYINRERDPDKKARMVYNHQRAKRMRGSNIGAAFSVVDDAIGALFARTPVDAQSRPTLTPDNVRKLVAYVTRSVGSPQKARALVASYVRINKIATPGLRVVKKG